MTFLLLGLGHFLNENAFLLKAGGEQEADRTILLITRLHGHHHLPDRVLRGGQRAVRRRGSSHPVSGPESSEEDSLSHSYGQEGLAGVLDTLYGVL